MTALDMILSILSAVSFPTLLGMVIHARAKNKKLIQETKHLETEDVQVISATALQLLTPLRIRVQELEDECGTLRKCVNELTDDLRKNQKLLEESAEKLVVASRRADYYQRAFETQAKSGGSS